MPGKRLNKEEVERREERWLQEDRAGVFNINLTYPVEYYFSHGWEPEVALEEELARHYHRDMVFVSGTGYGFGGDVRDMDLDVKGYAKELDTMGKRAFLKELVTLCRRTLKSLIPGLLHKNISANVHEYKWSECDQDLKFDREFNL